MPWEPWLQACEPQDPGEKQHDPTDPRLLVNVFRDNPDPMADGNVDWLEHLDEPKK